MSLISNTGSIVCHSPPEEERLEQPQEVRVLHDTAFMFWSPVQDEAVIRDLEGRGERLYLEGYRPRDKYRTETKIGMHNAPLPLPPEGFILPLLWGQFIEEGRAAS
jgi:hypothetical protein